LINVEQGILLAVVFSMVDHIRVSYRPPTHLLKLSADGAVVPVAVSTGEMALPGRMVYRFEAPLYHANAEFFMTEVRHLVRSASTPVRWFVVRFDSISDVDFTAAKMLLQLMKLLKPVDVSVVFSDVGPAVLKLLQRYGIAAELGSGRIFPDLTSAISDYRKISA
jgi:MFS superfamily sulfate permease-like transporter